MLKNIKNLDLKYADECVKLQTERCQTDIKTSNSFMRLNVFKLV